MKKIFLSLIVALMCILSAATCMAAEESILNKDFEDFPLGLASFSELYAQRKNFYIETDGLNKYCVVKHSDTSGKSSDNMLAKYDISISGETVFTFDVQNRNFTTGYINVQLRSDDGNSPDAGKNIINIVSINNGKITYLPDMAKLEESITEEDTASITLCLNPSTGSLRLYNNGVKKRDIENIYSLNNGSWKAFDFTKTVLRFQTYVKATPEGEDNYVTDIKLDNIRVFESDLPYVVFSSKLFFDDNTEHITELKNGPAKAKVSLVNKTDNGKNVIVFLTHKADGTLLKLGTEQVVLKGGETKNISCELLIEGANEGDIAELIVLDADSLTPLIAPKSVYSKPLIETPIEAELKYLYQKEKNPHPRIIATNDDFESIKNLVKTDAIAASWAKDIIAEANKMVDAEIGLATSPYYIAYTMSSTNDILTMSRRVLTMVETLGIAHKLSGEDVSVYSDKASFILNTAARFKDWNPSHFLDTAEMMTAFAIGYDWMYDAFDETTLKTIEKAVYEKGLLLAESAYNGTGGTQNSGWWKDVNYNWNTVCNSSIAIASAAFADSYPDLAFNLSAKAVNNIKKALKPFSPHGAYDEGYVYAIYSLDYLSRLQSSLKNTYGTDFGMMQNTGLSGIGDYLIHVDGSFGVNNYHDTNDYKTLFGYEHHIDTWCLSWLGNVFDNPKYNAARYRNLEKHNYIPTAYDLIWYNPGISSSDFKDIALDKYFAGTELVSMRSGFEKDDIFLSAHGGEANVSHSHIDGGTFVLDMLGTRFANDIGAESYSADGYFGDKRYEYYRTRAEGHNTIVINPDETPGQSTDCNLRFERTDFSSDNPFAILDMTPAYKDYGASSAKRGYMLCDNRQSAVIRDEIELASASTVYWFMQTTADVSVQGNTLTLTKDGKTIKVRFATNASQYELSYGNAEPLPESKSAVTNIQNTSYKRIYFKTTAQGSLNITVKFTSSSGDFADINNINNLSKW